MPEFLHRLFETVPTDEPARFVPALLAAIFAPAMTLLVCGCQATSSQDQPPVPPPTKVVGAKWALVALGGDSPQGEQPLTLELNSDGRFTGFAGVNQYFGEFRAQDSGRGLGPISFGDIGATRMAGPEPLMSQERRYLELLRQADSFRAEAGLMDLSAGGAPLLRFRKLNAAPLPG